MLCTTVQYYMLVYSNHPIMHIVLIVLVRNSRARLVRLRVQGKTWSLKNTENVASGYLIKNIWRKKVRENENNKERIAWSAKHRNYKNPGLLDTPQDPSHCQKKRRKNLFPVDWRKYLLKSSPIAPYIHILYTWDIWYRTPLLSDKSRNNRRKDEKIPQNLTCAMPRKSGYATRQNQFGESFRMNTFGNIEKFSPVRQRQLAHFLQFF